MYRMTDGRQNRVALCVVRAFAGLGGSLTLPAAFGIVGVTFTADAERTVAFAILGMGYPIGAALGQIIGGLIAGAAR